MYIRTSQPYAKAFPAQSPVLKSEIIPLYQRLSNDDQDSVRLLTIPDLIAICSQLKKSEIKAELGQCLQASCVDKSWRVRYMLADHFVEVSRGHGGMCM
jgi:serine/threonine-protein phosphatase 2A regulatory subunit A